MAQGIPIQSGEFGMDPLQRPLISSSWRYFHPHSTLYTILRNNWILVPMECHLILLSGESASKLCLKEDQVTLVSLVVVFRSSTFPFPLLDGPLLSTPPPLCVLHSANCYGAPPIILHRYFSPFLLTPPLQHKDS